MAYGSITVGDLRRAIEGLPDDSPVLFKPADGDEGASPLTKEQRRSLPPWVVIWDYNTREGHNAYQANDDRYQQNQVLLIELAGLSP